MKHLAYILIGCAITLSITSCSDFFDTAPYDALSPATTWKNENDARSFAVGCYNDWLSGSTILYQDCASDIGYNNFPWENWTVHGNGKLSASNPGASYYDFKTIRRCNDFLENIKNVTFTDETEKKDLIAQVRAIRAYEYFEMNFWYGGVPIINSYNTAEEAKVPRNSEDEVKKFIYDELDELIPDLKESPTELGRVAKGAGLAIKMRSALYWGDYQRAKEAALAIMNMNKYDLHPNYAELFTLKGKSSNEIILSVQYLENVYGLSVIGQMYNNADGGWSSIVPTQNLLDMYEMNDGLTKEESKLYDPKYPFKDRDPRMEMTILFPGQLWQNLNKETVILNTLDKNINGVLNDNYPGGVSNASKTALSWSKYLAPMDQYNNIWDTGACPIVFRYVEVLLSFAEVENELNGPSDAVYKALDQIRIRVGMPIVNRGKYGTKETLRELIRRERTIELAGEGLRKADILRWKDSDGKMLAEKVMNGNLSRITGTINYNEDDPYKRAVIEPGGSSLIETRKFAPYNRYLPIPQSSIDKNPNLKQNTGY